MSDDRLADLPCGEKAVTNVHGFKEIGWICIFKQGHQGLHYSKLEFGNDMVLWWGGAQEYREEGTSWTA